MRSHLTTVRPHMCGIGGDLFMLIYRTSQGRLDALNASGRSAARATLAAYRELGYKSVTETGIHTCTVPGAIGGWQAALDTALYHPLASHIIKKLIPYAAATCRLFLNSNPSGVRRGPSKL